MSILMNSPCSPDLCLIRVALNALPVLYFETW